MSGGKYYQVDKYKQRRLCFFVKSLSQPVTEQRYFAGLVRLMLELNARRMHRFGGETYIVSGDGGGVPGGDEHSSMLWKKVPSALAENKDGKGFLGSRFSSMMGSRG